MYLDPLQKRKLISLVIVFRFELGHTNQKYRSHCHCHWDMASDLSIEWFTESDPTLLILQKCGLASACKRWVKFWHQSSRPFMTSWSVFPPIKQLSLSLCHQWLAFTSCSNCVGQMNFCKLLKGIRLCYTSYINFLLTLE